MDGLGFFNRRKRFCEMLLWFRRHQALFETIIDFAIVSLNVVKTYVHAARTTCLKYTKFHNVRSISIRSSIGKALGWDSTINQFRRLNALRGIFSTLDNPPWTAFRARLMAVFLYAYLLPVLQRMSN